MPPTQVNYHTLCQAGYNTEHDNVIMNLYTLKLTVKTIITFINIRHLFLNKYLANLGRILSNQ